MKSTKAFLSKYTETSLSEIFSILSVKCEVNSHPGYKKKVIALNIKKSYLQSKIIPVFFCKGKIFQ